MYVEDAVKIAVGKTIDRVELSPDKERFTFFFSDGSEAAFGVDGDCCSHSWIEHLEAPNDLQGATFLGLEDSWGTDVTEDDSFNPQESYGRRYECLKVYQSKFLTSRGDICLEYRNSSNGYYGGYLVAL